MGQRQQEDKRDAVHNTIWMSWMMQHTQMDQLERTAAAAVAAATASAEAGCIQRAWLPSLGSRSSTPSCPP